MAKTTAATAILVALIFLAHRHTSRRVAVLERELADRQEREREKGRRLIATGQQDGHGTKLRLITGGIPAAPTPPLPLRRRP